MLISAEVWDWESAAINFRLAVSWSVRPALRWIQVRRKTSLLP